jgi:hypothetical protein
MVGAGLGERVKTHFLRLTVTSTRPAGGFRSLCWNYSGSFTVLPISRQVVSCFIDELTEARRRAGRRLRVERIAHAVHTSGVAETLLIASFSLAPRRAACRQGRQN